MFGVAGRRRCVAERCQPVAAACSRMRQTFGRQDHGQIASQVLTTPLRELAYFALHWLVLRQGVTLVSRLATACGLYVTFATARVPLLQQRRLEHFPQLSQPLSAIQASLTWSGFSIDDKVPSTWLRGDLVPLPASWLSVPDENPATLFFRTPAAWAAYR